MEKRDMATLLGLRETKTVELLENERVRGTLTRNVTTQGKALATSTLYLKRTSHN